MYDKRVRRRRAVLALLVALSLVLLTASFGSSGGALHSVQTGVAEVLAPIQDGANKALKPFRDLFGWFGDTLHAKGELAKVRDERDQLRREVIGATATERENATLRKQVALDRNAGLAQYGLVSATVTGRSPTLWYATININRGSSDGIRSGQPVIGDGGLIGTVGEVFSGSASVTLITDHSSAVEAKVNETGDYGILKPDVGNPNDLRLDYVSADSNVARGDRIVTSGTIPDPGRRKLMPSLFPAGIPIGYVVRVDGAGGNVYPTVHVHPYADLRRFDVVQVLTKNVPGDRAQVP